MVQIELHDGDTPILLRTYEFGWELCWKKNRKNAEDETIIEQYWSPAKWYSSLESALNAVAGRKIRNSDATTLQELIGVVNTIREELTKTYQVNTGGKND